MTKIYNIARSPPQSCALDIKVKAGTTYESALKLEKDVNDELKKDTRYFTGCTLRSVTSELISYSIAHTKNFQNTRVNRIKRDAIVNVFVKMMSKAGITHSNSFEFTE